MSVSSPEEDASRRGKIPIGGDMTQAKNGVKDLHARLRSFTPFRMTTDRRRAERRLPNAERPTPNTERPTPGKSPMRYQFLAPLQRQVSQLVLGSMVFHTD